MISGWVANIWETKPEARLRHLPLTIWAVQYGRKSLRAPARSQCGRSWFWTLTAANEWFTKFILVTCHYWAWCSALIGYSMWHVIHICTNRSIAVFTFVFGSRHIGNTTVQAFRIPHIYGILALFFWIISARLVRLPVIHQEWKISTDFCDIWLSPINYLNQRVQIWR